MNKINYEVRKIKHDVVRTFFNRPLSSPSYEEALKDNTPIRGFDCEKSVFYSSQSKQPIRFLNLDSKNGNYFFIIFFQE